MRVKLETWMEIVKLLATFIIGVISAILAQSCTVSMSISKNNSNSSQRTEQTSTSSIDSTTISLPLNH